MTRKSHLKICRKSSVVYVDVEASSDSLALIKGKACAALNITDLPNVFLLRRGVVQDEKALVCDLGLAGGDQLELMLRNEIAVKTDN